MSELIDITQNDKILARIFELYVNDSRRETLGYATLKNYIDWLKKVPNLAHTKIYTYGNWPESGLYLVVDHYQLMASSLKQNDSELGAAMKLLDWRRGYSIYPIAAMQYDIVLKTLEDVQAPLTAIKLFVFKLPREKALKWQIACPAEYEVSTLTTADAEFVDSVWPPRFAASIHYIRRLIELNVSVALRRRRDGALVAWCTRCFSGLISTLQVIDECQRQGLATLITCQYAQRIAALGEDVWSAVREANKASIACFEKMGFERCGTSYYFPAFKVPEDQLWVEKSTY